MSASAMSQIIALQAEKVARTPTQRKVDSQLLAASRMAKGQSVAAGVQTVSVALPYTSDGRVEVDVRADVSADVIAKLQALGAEVAEVSAIYRSIRVKVSLDQVEPIAGIPEVVSVRPKQQATTVVRRPTSAASFSRVEWQRARPRHNPIDRAALVERVQRALQAQTQGGGPGVQVVTSEGDATHKAANARGTYGVNGTGVKIGVLSDGVEHLAASQALGELPAVTVLPGQSGAGLCSPQFCDEGTAMLEIIYDLAPGAQLYFATAFNSITSFAQNIKDLRTAGCDIIIDDVGYFVESPFQDGQTGAVVSPNNAGIVAQAVKDVAAAGALYFSSAINSGNIDQGTAGTWEGNFVDGGALVPPVSTIEGAGRLHLFSGAQTYDVVTASFSNNFVSLSWSDPLGGASNDYDLFLLNSTGSTVLALSNDFQDGNDDPVELFNYTASMNGDRLVVVKFSGSDRFLHLDTNGAELSIATTGSTHGHPTTTALTSFSVAATPAASDNGFGGTPGPYPNPFNAANKVEPFSSDGPRRIFFSGDGSPITPGNFLATGGQVLSKPDLTAADGVSVTGVGGFGSPFFGTSAAAPHLGAIAALVKSAYLPLTASQIRTALIVSAIDIHAAGWDRDSGYGIVMADTAVANGASPSISSHPFSASIPYGTTKMLSVTASGPGLSYQWYQGPSGNTSTPVGTNSNSFLTPSLISNTKYWVRVFNTFGSVNSHAATVTVLFTDNALGTSITVKVVHFTQLRARIDAMRQRYGGHPPFPYSHPTLTPGASLFSALDVTEMRTALAQAYADSSIGAPNYTSNPAPGSSIVVADINDLRLAVTTLEDN